jgi:transcriptional regulator with XRE-family HTH domain
MQSTKDVLSRVALRLKDARKAKNLSLDAVAKLSGVSRSMVSQIERGESSPTVSTLWNLTQALKIDFAELVEDPCNRVALRSCLRPQPQPSAAWEKGAAFAFSTHPRRRGNTRSMSSHFNRKALWTVRPMGQKPVNN